MGQILHGSATTTEAIRRAIQNSQENLRALAKHYGINQKRSSGRGGRRSPICRLAQRDKVHVAIVRGRGHHCRVSQAYAAAAGRLPLCPSGDHPASRPLIASSLPSTPGHLSASDVEDGKGVKRKFKAYPIGYFHVDIAEVRTAECRLYLFVAIDRTSKFAFTELHEKAPTRVAADFLCNLIKAVPYKIHTALTDNGIHFTDPSGESWKLPRSTK